jgi:hypothetical protein
VAAVPLRKAHRFESSVGSVLVVLFGYEQLPGNVIADAATSQLYVSERNIAADIVE